MYSATYKRMEPRHPHIVLLTGLGADERLFDAQRPALPGLVTPGWIAPRLGEGLAEYAERFAAEIPIARPLLLGGCSLGGMMAYEMAHVLRPDALVYISSAVSRKAIPLHLRALARIAWLPPPAGYWLGKRTWPVIVSTIRRREPEHIRLTAAMARDASAKFLRWACIAVGRWQPRTPLDVPTYTIHGDRDLVLPLGKRACDYLIPGAGHLLTVTHASEVNAALREIVDRVARTAGKSMVSDIHPAARV
jgi:pimeloyl-ACP methyl ester carboxylesterase